MSKKNQYSAETKVGAVLEVLREEQAANEIAAKYGVHLREEYGLLINKAAGLAFGVGALSMMGFPLFAGFASKLYLASASIGMMGFPLFAGFASKLYLASASIGKKGDTL